MQSMADSALVDVAVAAAQRAVQQGVREAEAVDQRHGVGPHSRDDVIQRLPRPLGLLLCCTIRTKHDVTAVCISGASECTGCTVQRMLCVQYRLCVYS